MGDLGPKRFFSGRRDKVWFYTSFNDGHFAVKNLASRESLGGTAHSWAVSRRVPGGSALPRRGLEAGSWGRPCKGRGDGELLRAPQKRPTDAQLSRTLPCPRPDNGLAAALACRTSRRP